MGANVDANGRSILHKGHGMTHTCPVPDVCKTPSPGGPIPIPYVNVAMDSDIADGAATVQIEGNPVANLGAKIATSTGDEAGSAGGGIMSSKIKGTVTWKMGSLDVKAEGKSVVRFLETNFHNGNAFNTTGPAPGETGMTYGGDFDEDCPVCHKAMTEHQIVETLSSAEKCSKIIEYLKNRWDGVKNGEDDVAKKMVAKSYFDRDSGKVEWAGYMVGVMICAHKPPKSFAAMSGSKMLPAFKDACANASIDVVINDGSKAGGQPRSVKWGDIASANTSAVAGTDALKDAVRKAWFDDAGTREGSNSPPPGKCAGQHLIARSGHGPIQMTEMYFAPSGFWGQTYSFIVDGVRRAQFQRFGTDLQKTDETPWGTSVGSCKTCQDLLFLAMCPERVCKKK
jgi:uncharacterized Zn-binding protein involved in type VI secretion